MIKVEISEDAREYILSKFEAITVDSETMFSCGGPSKEPIIFESKPSAPENFDEVNADGLVVYISKRAIIDPGGIRIYLMGDKIAFQSLQVEGLRFEL